MRLWEGGVVGGWWVGAMGGEGCLLKGISLLWR